jgi:GntR family transcriptional regulator/MocR family aminotransferase
MEKTPFLSISLDKHARKPIYMQICDVVRQRIIEGRLAPGSSLPSSRNYAIELGVSRTSIVSAFEQLKAEGYLKARQGSGYFVTPIGNLDKVGKFHVKNTSDSPSDSWETSAPIKQTGAGDMRLFPYRQWAQCVTRVARESPESLLQAVDPFGDHKLRESIAQYLFDWRGIELSPKQILITAGSIDALEICVRTLIRDGDLIGLENPGYRPLRNFVQQEGFSPTWLSVDQNGARIPKPNTKTRPPKMVVLTPSHQFPLGGAMSPERRANFINWAEKSNSWIIEDDYDSEFRYAGKPIPALTGRDWSGRSIYVGSFAKIFSTGLRLGFLVTPPELQEEFSLTLSRFTSRASSTMQRVLSVFMDNGMFYRHIRRVRRVYAERRKTLIDCLDTELGHILSYDDYHAGMQFVTRLPEEYDDGLVAQAAKKAGVFVSPLSDYYAGNDKKSGLLIDFCGYQNDEIVRNISILREVLEQFDPTICH